MLPVLFSAGSITIYTFGFLLALGFFLSGFLIWRRLRELGLDEEKTIDFLLFFILLAFVFARLGYILTHFDEFGLSIGRWFLIGRFPGFSFGGALVGGVFASIFYCRRSRWNFWQIADEIVFGLLPLTVLIQVGCFFDGCLLGIPTSMPWGIYFPGDFIRRQPISLFATLIFFLIWIFLLRIERHWRTWDWYKNKAEGFISLSFLGLTFLASFLLAFLEEGGLYYLLFRKGFDFLGFLLVLGLFYKRSGVRLRKEKPR